MVRAKVTFANETTYYIDAEDFNKLFEALKDQYIVNIEAKEVELEDLRQGRDKWVH